MDDIDYATERAANFNAISLSTALQRPTRYRSTGVCPSCHERIEAERLSANPFAVLCGDCAAEEEELLKRRRRCGPR